MFAMDNFTGSNIKWHTINGKIMGPFFQFINFAWLKTIQSLKECTIGIFCSSSLEIIGSYKEATQQRNKRIDNKTLCVYSLNYYVQNGTQESQERTSQQK